MSSSTSHENIQLGCQGWNYKDWVTGPAGDVDKVFYPRGTRTTEMLQIYARAFSTVEVDSTFYAVPPLSSIENWYRRTPREFTFSLKLPREITHEHALRGGVVTALLTDFCERARALREKLGVILVQLPPQFAATAENRIALREFLTQLPKDVRFSIEFRDNNWVQESTIDLLAGYPYIAFALVEGPWLERARMWRFAENLTSGFAYVRWMGERDLTRFDIVQRPQDENLDGWAAILKRLSRRAPKVYAYFSNFYEGHAPISANKLKRLLGQPTVTASDLENQPSLF